MPARIPLRGARPPARRDQALIVGAISLACVFAAIPAASAAQPARAQLAAPARAMSASSASARAVSAAPGSGGTRTPARFFNVSLPHSPRLLRMLASRAGASRPAAAIPSGVVQGVDVASHQHPNGQPIDWSQVAAAGYKFAFIKATEGSYYVNPYYASDLAQARAAGLLVAGYHFANPSYSSGTLQADFALNAQTYAANGATLPFILDVEYDPYGPTCYGLSTAQMVAWISAFTAEIKRRTGQPTIIYTTAGWWNQCTAGSTAFGSDPLWIASYSSTAPAPAAGWSDWTYWQFTSTATVPGIAVKNGVDVSSFNPAMLAAVWPGTQSNAAGSSVHVPLRSLNALAGQSITYLRAGLPAGLTIGPSGVIGGTLPTRTAFYRATVTITNSSDSVHIPIGWQVHGPVRLYWPGRQSTPAGGPASLQIRSSDDQPGCGLQFAATGLPPGLSISPCGQITGWATQPGRYMVHVHAADSSGGTVGAVSFAWTVTTPDPGASGRIRLTLPGKLCLASVSRVTVSVQTCWRSGGQIWDYVQNGTIRLNGRCLTAQGSTTVGFATCDRTAGQEWQYQPGGSLLNGGTGQCLADFSAGTQPAPVRQAACDGAASQAWTLPAGPLFAGLPGDCLAAVRPRTGSLLHLVVTRCARTAGQSWAISPGGTLSVLGHCLTAHTPLWPGAPAALSVCGGTVAQRARQQWQPLTENGYSFLVEPLTGLCLGGLLHGSALSAVGLRHCTAGYPRLGWAIS
jgi:GH25 family lysozyme M1 (1,4-beta-N-acetylmuramidase)